MRTPSPVDQIRGPRSFPEQRPLGLSCGTCFQEAGRFADLAGDAPCAWAGARAVTAVGALPSASPPWVTAGHRCPVFLLRVEGAGEAPARGCALVPSVTPGLCERRGLGDSARGPVASVDRVLWLPHAGQLAIPGCIPVPDEGVLDPDFGSPVFPVFAVRVLKPRQGGWCVCGCVLCLTGSTGAPLLGLRVAREAVGPGSGADRPQRRGEPFGSRRPSPPLETLCRTLPFFLWTSGQ